MSYKLSITHVRPYYRNGDRETEFAKIDTKIFKTIKTAKAFVELDAKVRKCTTVNYYKSGTIHYWCGFTNVSWFNEGTGNTENEQYQYKLIKE